MKIEDIKDRESLVAWLKPRPQADGVAISHRSALRVMPLWMSAMDQPWARSADLTAVPILRQNLTLGVLRKFSNPKVQKAATAAAADAAAVSAIATAAPGAVTADAAAAAAAYATSASAFAAAYAAAAAFTDPVAFWKEIRQDAQKIENDQDLFSAPLWSGEPSDWFMRPDQKSRALWSVSPVPWSFWRRWWDGILSGHPLDWELQKAVALIPDKVWKQGPEKVAEAIAAIEVHFTIAQTPNSEDVVRDENGLFYTVPVSTIRPDLYRAAIEKVQDTIIEIRAAPRLANCLSFLAEDLTRLEDHFARYGNQPLRIHDVYLKTIRHLDTLRAEGLIPVDGLLTDFHQDLDTGAVDIRRSDSEVAKTVKFRVGDRLARLRPDKKADADQAISEAAEESRAELKEDLRQDFATATDPKAEPQDKDESSYRLVSRLSRMAKRRKDDVVKAGDEIGKVVRGAEGLGKAAEGAQAWWEWIISNLPGLGG